MTRRTRILLSGLGLGAVLFAAATFGALQRESSRDTGRDTGEIPGGVVVAPDAAAALPNAPGASLDEMIASLQARLEAAPNDHVAWATLGLAYVQQAKVTVNPEYYPKAEGALQRSLDLGVDDNYLVHAGLSALAAARHDFSTAKQQALAGLAMNPYNALLYGALGDAEIQLGNYDAAFDAVQRMVDLSPDTASLSRASYTWELRGDTDRARQLMQRALDDAPTPADRAFAEYYLGELDFNAGDPNTALQHYINALAASPTDAAALAGRAKAEAALGQVETALDHYADVVERVPEPAYLIEYGELLESLGRRADAQRQYDLVTAVQRLFTANGVAPDAGPTLFLANHGDPVAAVAEGEGGVAARPFLVMQDAYAWALHQSGRDQEALDAITAAMELGTPSALFHYHAGMIRYSLGDLDAARAELAQALAINPYFNPLEAPTAVRALAALDQALEVTP